MVSFPVLDLSSNASSTEAVPHTLRPTRCQQTQKERDDSLEVPGPPGGLLDEGGISAQKDLEVRYKAEGHIWVVLWEVAGIHTLPAGWVHVGAQTQLEPVIGKEIFYSCTGAKDGWSVHFPGTKAGASLAD